MHAIQWVEIPALNLDRAFSFYYALLNQKVRKGTFGQGELILFDVPFNNGEAVGGSIVVREDLIPTTEGPVIYLNAFGALNKAVEQVEPNGGKVIAPFIDLGKFGFAAIFIDSEGNKIGLLSHEK